MIQQLSHVTVCGVRNAFAGLERRICSVTSVTMANARVFRQSLDIKGNSQCLKLGSEVFTFTVFYDASNEWPYPYTEKYEVSGTYKKGRVQSDLQFFIESMLYHCTVEDDLFAVTTEMKVELIESDVTTPTLSDSWTTPDSMHSGLSNVYGTLKVPTGFFNMTGSTAAPDRGSVECENTASVADVEVSTTESSKDINSLSGIPEVHVTSRSTPATAIVTVPDVTIVLHHFARKWTCSNDGSEWRSLKNVKPFVFHLYRDEHQSTA